MVINHNLDDIFEVTSKITTISLPTDKLNGLKIHYLETNEIRTVYGTNEPPLPFANSEVFLAKISSWRRLTPLTTGCKAVYEVTFDVKDSNFNFKAGDTIGIIPKNNDDEVELIVNHLSLTSQANTAYSLHADNETKAKIPSHVPLESTIRYVLKHCLEIRCVLKKLFLLALARYTNDENERKVLEFLSSKEGSTAYNKHILQKKMCILDIFTIFKTCKPPIEVLLANLPRLLPRPYSIVNSGLKDCSILKICFSVMDIGNSRKGVTTGWLENILNKESTLENQLNKLQLGELEKNKIAIYLRKNLNEFNLPDDLEPPMILIGTGTGVSPFIGFLEEMELRKNGLEEMGDCWLFFGCRNLKLDFIYEEELNEFARKGVLNKLVTAFSRTEIDTSKYVQDAIIENGAGLVHLINQGASIFVCGDLKLMATQVKESIKECLIKYNNLSVQESEKLLFDMEKRKKYVVDIWN